MKLIVLGMFLILNSCVYNEFNAGVGFTLFMFGFIATCAGITIEAHEKNHDHLK